MIKERIDERTGELKPMDTLVFQNTETGERFQFWEDGGLKNALATAGAEMGQVLLLVFQGKTKLGGGKSGEVNVWEVHIAGERHS